MYEHFFKKIKWIAHGHFSLCLLNRKSTLHGGLNAEVLNSGFSKAVKTTIPLSKKIKSCNKNNLGICESS